ncbi:MAG: FHA domain-containing protein [Anaerolineales bacterium]|nr:FHA domain-containing protein [Anaerolineales bacterium]
METEDTFPVMLGQTGPLNGVRWVLDEETMIIGRSPDCKFVIGDRQVSRQHAVIHKIEKGYSIRDLGSKNGTYVNGARVEDAVILQDGDLVQLAFALQLAFIGTEATLPLSAAGASELGISRLRMDIQARRVYVCRNEIIPPLSPSQFRFLEVIYMNPDRVVSRDEIVASVWPESESEGVSEQAIDALVRRLRERLFEVDPEINYVETVRGHGFRINNPV